MSDADPDVERRWWKEAVVYQIYPKSFNDTDGDGIGDIPGIIERVDYLDELGIDVVWLTPVYASPMADNGYDVSDYRAIHPAFGTMADWERLVEELHARDIRLIMDLVANHTSDEHEWFVRSKAGDPEYEKYYWWHEGVDADSVEWESADGPAGEAPPNGWRSLFGGPAWAYDEGREEWYLHLFDRKQPDLNWRNEALRESVYEMMEWWLEKGIDGFRLDAIAHIGKTEGLPTDLEEPLNGTMKYAGNTPQAHEYLTEMNDRVFDRDLLTVGEVGTPSVPEADARAYLDPGRDGLSMLTHFEHVSIDQQGPIYEPGEWTLPELKAVLDRWDGFVAEGGWTAQFLSNHDHPRQVSRFGSEAYREESATLLGTLLHTLRGTPFVYQGEELGMTNYPWRELSEFADVATRNPVERAIERGEVESFEAVREAVAGASRDNGRTPVQWTDGEHAGFTDGEPWIPVNPDKDEVNAERARADPDSVWHYYRELIALRSGEMREALIYGEYDQLTPDHESLWAYTRTHDEERLLVLLNFDDDPTPVALPSGVLDADTTLERLLANYALEDESAVPAVLEGSLRPWEARVYRVRTD
ncbi:glycoside hydrolase family 13 protein [Halalkalicoccus jeotgali]|uniref:Alpha amylase catalytic region n=1 Tax=Halalkalicoccus jeotgali (strain DSM 18796 / CECT 7217 / JCM 14584 / KCTC 4019 / B3) TaxID=795797 RepID=D8J7H2_HALJB|nr:alpha-glucosidase [Halalkalicoccus jeotgali]ADJ14067.1 alpha amylase catalytic region [Halalkalicoccus jeotgali B3]ELY33889.1 alpha amylase catalytic subunit [Halalkalicoccus jeotgali B3]